jgi:aryl-alcohol dehydrogenase-like predicted oxidoreductase
LKRIPDLGINFIDTADSYGPDVSEHFLRKALHPYDRILGPVLNCDPTGG